MVASEMRTVAESPAGGWEAGASGAFWACTLPPYTRYLSASPTFSAHTMRDVIFAIIFESGRSQADSAKKQNTMPPGNYWRHGAKCSWKGNKRNTAFAWPGTQQLEAPKRWVLMGKVNYFLFHWSTIFYLFPFFDMYNRIKRGGEEKKKTDF